MPTYKKCASNQASSFSLPQAFSISLAARAILSTTCQYGFGPPRPSGRMMSVHRRLS